jgi:hypothetical protein
MTALRRRSARTSGTLLALYDAVLTQHTDARTGGLARPLRDAVAQHVTALSPAAAAAWSCSAQPPAPAAATPPTVPAGRAAALKALAEAERHTADSHITALLDAPSELARLLASVAAACSAHAYLLSRGDY